MSQIKISTHEGKMRGIKSISTSPLLNHNCQKNRSICGSICQKCFSHALCGFRKSLRASLEANTKLLTSRVLADSELPNLTGESVFRFCSFGDLNNETQLQNYINIAKKNPGTKFALWSKQYNLCLEYFKKHDVPENFTLILSSLMMNKRINLDSMKKLGKFKPGQLKSFTVFDKSYIAAHPLEAHINCGSRSCLGCRQCYDQVPVEEINEVLKSDQGDAYKTLEEHDAGYIAERKEMLSDMDNL